MTPFTQTHHPVETEPGHLQGRGVSPGIAIGHAYVYTRETIDVGFRSLKPDEVEGDVARFERAVQRADRDLKKIIAITREKVGEDSAAIFEAQQLMLHDEAVHGTVIRLIYKEKVNAAFAVQKVMEKHRRVMESSDSEYLRERANDLLDVQDRIIRHLRRGRLLSAIDPDRIVVAENLTAADMILFSRRGILGCALDFGGPTSHVSIMARSLGIPAVMSMHGVTGRVSDGDMLVLDGIRGEVIVNPSPAELDAARTRKERYSRLLEDDLSLVPLPSETLDGFHISLEANLELREELPLLIKNGAEGVGLFRSEMIFLMEGRISVSEEDQLAVYRSIVEASGIGPVTFRVLDLGGDKLLPMAHREQNPFLGWRGIRILLDRPDLLMPQLRAILRASAFGPTRILVPMVTDVAEIRTVREYVEKAKEGLRSEGHAFDENVPLGIMVEVPSVALMADRFAAESDFFSIGTNDLTQYVLAVDRGNDLVADLYRDLHPAVLILIRNTVKAAKKAGIPVSVCGELATNLRAVPILIGLGVDSLSVSPVFLPGVKRVVRAMKRSEGEMLARKALKAIDATELTTMLDRWLDTHACGVAFFLEGNGAKA